MSMVGSQEEGTMRTKSKNEESISETVKRVQRRERIGGFFPLETLRGGKVLGINTGDGKGKGWEIF